MLNGNKDKEQIQTRIITKLKFKIHTIQPEIFEVLLAEYFQEINTIKKLK